MTGPQFIIPVSFYRGMLWFAGGLSHADLILSPGKRMEEYLVWIGKIYRVRAMIQGLEPFIGLPGFHGFIFRSTNPTVMAWAEKNGFVRGYEERIFSEGEHLLKVIHALKENQKEIPQ